MLSRFQKDPELGGREGLGNHPQSWGVSLATTTNWGSLGLRVTTLCPSDPSAGQSHPNTFITALLVPQNSAREEGTAWWGQGGEAYPARPWNQHPRTTHGFFLDLDFYFLFFLGGVGWGGVGQRAGFFKIGTAVQPKLAWNSRSPPPGTGRYYLT